MQRRRPLLVALVAALLAGCGGGAGVGSNPVPQASAGQVAPAVAPAQASRFAAARLLEQATFGVKADDLAAVQRLGIAGWINEQLPLPATQLDGRLSIDLYVDADGRQPAYWAYQNEFYGAVLSRPDQLRQRVAWALSQFLVVSLSAGDPYGVLEYHNLLLRQAFGNYGALLREMTLNPAMGAFLDNRFNRPASACDGCAPNENFARELLQLFSVGVNRLEPDGTPQRDARGRTIETYSQQDVAELARALTGWEFDLVPRPPEGNLLNYGKPMIAPNPSLHDKGAKVVMGTSFPAGQTAAQDLDRVVALLMAHPNTAPFVSLRLIQHLVTSDPTPGYVGRVAAVFRDNGRGVAGDLAAVVRAVLLDPEARRGDAGRGDSARTGKLREPMLFVTALMRGLGCTRAPVYPGRGVPFTSESQQPMFAPSVFSFYSPTDVAPGSNLLAPEQRLLDTAEARNRATQLRHWAATAPAALADAGCDLPGFAAAAARSPRELADRINERWFRGTMPPTLRAAIERLWFAPGPDDPLVRTASVIGLALSSPAFGVMR